MWPFILGSFYIVLALWWLNRHRFVRESGLSAKQVSVVFVAKCLAAMAYGYIGGPLYGYRFDTWQQFQESLVETDLLLRDPVEFVASLFRYSEGQVFFSMKTGMNFINNFQFNFHYKLVAVFNLFSGRNYYVNTLFFSFFTFYGILFLIRLVKIYFHKPGKLLFYTALLLTGFIFWGNGMYKEGWIFTGLCAGMYGAERVLETPRYAWLIVIGLLVLAVTRMFTLFLFFPFLLYYIGWKKWGRGKWLIPGFLILLTAGILLVSWSGWYDLPADIIDKRNDFLRLKGDSLLDAQGLAPTWESLLAYIPHALEHTLLRPFPWEVAGKLVYLPSALEIILLEIAVLYWISRKGWRFVLPAPFQLLLVFALLNFILIGWTVPFLGAIVRYRSIYLPFIVLPLVFTTIGKRFNKIPMSDVN